MHLLSQLGSFVGVYPPLRCVLIGHRRLYVCRIGRCSTPALILTQAGRAGSCQKECDPYASRFLFRCVANHHH